MSRRPRNTIQTELGEEVQCTKCGDFWPADPEFFFFSNGRPHSWCKACYLNDPNIVAKVKRGSLKKTAERRARRLGDGEAQGARA